MDTLKPKSREESPRPRRPRPRHPWVFERLERRMLLSTSPIVATPADLASAQPLSGQGATGFVTPGSTAFFRLNPSTDELLVATLQAPGASTRLTLLDGQGRELTQSDGISATNPEDLIAQHLSSGTDYLEVEGLAGAGRFDLTTSQANSTLPDQPITVPGQPFSGRQLTNGAVAEGYFTGSGRLDLAVGTGNGLEVLLGNGDGTFAPPTTYLAGNDVTALVAGNFNGDGPTDLATVTSSAGLQVLLSNGKGGFTLGPSPFLAGADPTCLAAGDFTGSGRTDLAVGTNNGVEVLLATGGGNFAPPIPSLAGADIISLVTGEFTHDGRLDLAVSSLGGPGGANQGTEVLLGNGNGTFAPTSKLYLADTLVTSLVAGEFTNSGLTDLAAVSNFPEAVDVLLSKGDGTFAPPTNYLANAGVTSGVTSVVAGDFGGSGRTDLAFGTNSALEVLVNNGDGTFSPPTSYLAGHHITSMVAGEFTSDGRTDLAAVVGSGITDGVEVLLGDGDGTFAPGGANVSSVVSGEFTNDGRTDLAIGTQNGVELLLGNGDGTFTPTSIPFLAGVYISTLVAGYFNGDGRLDLAVGTYASGLEVLLGHGDGTFSPPTTYLAGDDVSSLAAGDFRSDGRTDLAVGTYNGVEVLMNNGDGNFAPPTTYLAGDDVTSLVAARVTGDGRTDLAVGFGGFTSGYYGGKLDVLLGKGDGTFTPTSVPYLAGDNVTSLVAGEFTSDGRTDLAVGTTNGVEVLLNDGNANFAPPTTYLAGDDVSSLVAARVTGDLRFDLAVGTYGYISNGGLKLLRNDGDGKFPTSTNYLAGDDVTSVVAGEFTSDGRLDLAAGTYSGVEVVLGNGDGTFSLPQQLAANSQANPIVVDPNGDLAVVDQAGDILLRQAIPGQPGQYEPPITINPGSPALDITAITSGGRYLIVAVDRNDNALSLYAYEDGSFDPVGKPLPTGQRPAQVVSADLNGEGIADLVVRNAGDGTASVFIGQADGMFTAMPAVAIGLGNSSIALADLDGSGHVGLIVTNEISGDVRYYPGVGNGGFGPPSIYQAGGGPYAQGSEFGDSTGIASEDATAGVAFFQTSPGGLLGLATINPGSNTLGVLDGLGEGALANAQAIDTTMPGQVIRAGDFTGNGLVDLAVLGSDGVTIYLANGQGGFTRGMTYDVGLNATGLTVADITGDGKEDLLVGDTFGDVLILIGNGDGTFQNYQRPDQAVALAVADLTGNGQEDFIYADQASDKVSVQDGGTTTTLADQQQGLLAPAAVTPVNFPGDPVPDLVVADSGSNDILVYSYLGDGKFGVHTYATGTNPVGITVAYLIAGDDSPDLIVANDGSNDVSVFIGVGTGANWTLEPGVRYQAGRGPVSTVVETLPGNPYPDLLVSDSQSNLALLIPGAGQGTFNDLDPEPIPVGSQPSQVLQLNPLGGSGGTGAVVVDTGSNELTVILDLEAVNVAETVSSGGIEPVAAIYIEEDGEEGLVVANQGDGEIALFLSGVGGLSFLREMTDPDAPDPTGLAVDPLTGAVYVSTAGMEHAFALPQGFLSLGSTGGGGGGSEPQGPSTSLQVAQLQPIGGGSTLALVASLATVTLTAEEVAEAGTPGVETTAAVAALPNQSPRLEERLNPVVDETEATDGEGSIPGASTPGVPLSPLARFLFGLDEAFERARLEASRLLGGPRADAGGVGRALEVLDAILAGWSPAIVPADSGNRVGAGSTPETSPPTSATIPAGADRENGTSCLESSMAATIGLVAFALAVGDRPVLPRRSKPIARP